MELFENDLLTMDVGARLRQLRTERGKSMRSLASLSGLSTNALSMIERGRTSPSVSTLIKLSEALDVPVTAFFRLEAPRKNVVFCRSEDRKRVPILNGLWEGMGGEAFSGQIEPFILTVDPGIDSGTTGMLHTGSEMAMCLRGQFEYEVEGELYLLNPGDLLMFTAKSRHSWRNVGPSKAEVLIVYSGFEQGERPGEFHVASRRSHAASVDDLIDRAEAMDLDEGF